MAAPRKYPEELRERASGNLWPGAGGSGLQGYETGTGVAESTDLAAATNRRRPVTLSPGEEADQGGGGGGIYVGVLGRSVRRRVVDALHANLATRARIVCDDPTACCPDGMDSTLRDRRTHAVRSRARYLAEIDRMPQEKWRLYKIAQDAQAAAHLIGVVNSVLVDAGITPMKATGQQSLAAVARHLRGDSSAVA